MENILKHLYERFTMEERTLGILLVEKEKGLEEITNFQDVIILILTSDVEDQWSIEHYRMYDKKVAIHFVGEDLSNCWMASGDNSRFVDWIFNGKILYQKGNYIEGVKDRVREFPLQDRKKKIAVEYARLIRHFEAGKSLFQTKNYLDAFFHILQALHHQARLAIIERGFYPEVTLWNQVKYIEPEMYKLYQEMLAGDESIDKKLQLIMIANEFAISAKVKVGSVHLLDILQDEGRAVSVSYLMKKEEIKEYQNDLEVFLEFLVRKGIVHNAYNDIVDSPNALRLYSVASIRNVRSII